MTDRPRLLDKKEIAAVLNVTVWAIDRWVQLRKIPFVNVGRRVMFDPLDIEKWLTANKVKPVD